jgi:DNA-binding MarR family transcriptional regulator
VTPQGIASTVRRLTAAGWVDRRPHPVHGRIVLLALTEIGQRVLHDAIEIADQLEALVTQDISATDRASLIRALDQMQARIVPVRT